MNGSFRTTENNSQLPGLSFRGVFHSLFRTIVIFIFLFLTVSTLVAQTVAKDSLTALSKNRANKAATYSAILPGAGQMYNHKYWKLPLVIGGFVTLYLISDFDNTYYHDFRNAYVARADGDPATLDPYPALTLDDIRVRKDYYRRNRDFCYILMGGFYLLNIVDAYVDAQLKDFDVSDKLTLKLHPEFSFSANFAPQAGVGMTFCLH